MTRINNSAENDIKADRILIGALYLLFVFGLALTKKERMKVKIPSAKTIHKLILVFILIPPCRKHGGGFYTFE
ncbi:hypothetical protein ACQ0QQ_00095 [Lysinibacillus sphaericus]